MMGEKRLHAPVSAGSRAGLVCFGLLAFTAFACSSGDDDSTSAPHAGAAGTAAVAGGESGTGGASSGAGGTNAAGSGGAAASGGSGGHGGSSGKPATGGGSNGGRGGTSAGAGAGTGGGMASGGDAGVPEMGKPGCGLDAAAFCDTFDKASKNRGRAGELDATLWSGSRMAPDGPTAGGQGFGVRASTLRPLRDDNGTSSQLPACRSDLGDSVFPDDDALICDPNGDIASSHLLVAVGSQNYGQNSYRIRQPFDFAGRTGTIVYDAEALDGGLLGWISLDLTEDPIGAPSFQTQNNLEGGILPRSGLSIQFGATCAGQNDSTSISEVHVFDDYAETIIANPSLTCVQAAWGKLNHFEVSVSETHLKVQATPFAPDGVTFGDPVTLWDADVKVPFSRGYVQITTHNHATVKYSAEGSGFGDGFTNLDAWITRWDNVGFDGPIIDNFREYEIGDPLEKVTIQDYMGMNVEARSTGYLVADESMSPNDVLTFHGVDTSGVQAAHLAVSAWYCVPCSPSDVPKYTLRYRINGNAWIDRPLDSNEVEDLTMGNGRGAVGHILDVPVDQLMPGDNTVEFLAKDVPQNYPPGVTNIDLILSL